MFLPLVLKKKKNLLLKFSIPDNFLSTKNNLVKRLYQKPVLNVIVNY